MSLDPESLDSHPPLEAQRTSLPGIFLIVVGAFNILWSLYQFFSALMALVTPPQQIWEANKRIIPGYFAEMEKAGWTPEKFRNVSVGINGGLGLLVLVTSIIIIAAGIRMRMLRSYGLAVTGAILACVPLLSCLGCCGLGEAVGIWALVVLVNPQVKTAFH